MYRLSFRAFLYMQGPYSSSSWPYHLSQSLHWSRTGSCAWRMQSGGYVIGLDTPEVYYANLFGTTLAKRFPGLWVKMYFRRRNRLLNGKEFVEEIYTVRAVSKFLYDFLRPHKQRDFHWTIPSSIRESRACTRGFLQGIY